MPEYWRATWKAKSRLGIPPWSGSTACSRSEAIGKTLEAIFPQELRHELAQVSDPHHTLNLYKFRLRNAQDRPLILNLSVVPLIGKENQVIGRLLIFTDLTERVNLEDQLMQAEKLSSIGLLAAGVAHEVNTPLAIIASNAQMLDAADGSGRRAHPHPRQDHHAGFSRFRNRQQPA